MYCSISFLHILCKLFIGAVVFMLLLLLKYAYRARDVNTGKASRTLDDATVTQRVGMNFQIQPTE